MAVRAFAGSLFSEWTVAWMAAPSNSGLLPDGMHWVDFPDKCRDSFKSSLMKRNNKSKASKRRVNQRNPMAVSVQTPVPRIEYFVPRFHYRLRYVKTGDTTSTILRGDLLNLFTCAIGTGTAVRLIEAIRLVRIHLYQEPPFNAASSTTGQSSVAVEWTSDLGPERPMIVSGFASTPLVFSSRAPPKSRASFWSRSGSDEQEELLNIDARTGCILDLDLEVQLMGYRSVPLALTIVGGGAAAGQVVFNVISTWSPQEVDFTAVVTESTLKTEQGLLAEPKISLGHRRTNSFLRGGGA